MHRVSTPGSWLLVLLTCLAGFVGRVDATPLPAGQAAPDPDRPTIRLEKRIFQSGEDIEVRFEHLDGTHEERVGLYPATEPSSAGTPFWVYLDGSQERTDDGTPTSGTVNLPTKLAQPGIYEVRLVRADETLASIKITIGAERTTPPASGDSGTASGQTRRPPERDVRPLPGGPGAASPGGRDSGGTILMVEQALFTYPSPIEVRFINARGDGSEKIGLFRASDPEDLETRVWKYLDDTIDPSDSVPTQGTVTFDGRRTLREGAYEARFLRDGEVVAVTPLFIENPQRPEVPDESRSFQRTAIGWPEEELPFGRGLVTFFVGIQGLGNEWIGVFPADAPNDIERAVWKYCNNSPLADELEFRTQGQVIFNIPDLMPGDYVVRLIIGDVDEEGVPRTYYDPNIQGPLRIVGHGSRIVQQVRGDLCSMTLQMNGEESPEALKRVVDLVIEHEIDLVALQGCSPATVEEIARRVRLRPSMRDVVASPETGIISRFPVVATHATDGPVRGVTVQLPDTETLGGDRVRVFSADLDDSKYGPYLARDYATEEDILEAENAIRLPQIERALESLIDHPDHDPTLATLLLGDFASPSFYDWVPSVRALHFGLDLEWPVSYRIVEAGFVDGWRQVHPEPRANPGYTWTTPADRSIVPLGEVHDRIDMAYHRSAASDGDRCNLRAFQTYMIDHEPHPFEHRPVITHYRVSQ